MKFKEVESEYTFVAEKKMPSGMTARITFYGDYWDDQKTAEFNIFLVVFKKRKQISELYLKSTGKDGLKTLFFAKKAVFDFEKFIVEKYGRCHEKMFINIGWDDNQRRDLYYRGLKKYGYDFNFFYGRKVLSKRIK